MRNMLKTLGLLAFLLTSAQSFAQVYQKNFLYGAEYQRVKPDSVQHLPRKYTMQLNTNDTTPQAFLLEDTLCVYSRGVYFKLYQVKKLTDTTLLVGADTIKVGGGGGGSGGPFYDSTLMASVQRLKDTAAALRVAPGNDQDIIHNSGGSPAADDNLTYNSAFRAMCLGCNVTYGGASFFGGGLTNGTFDIASNAGHMRVTGDTATIQARPGANNMFRVVTNNQERLAVGNAGDWKLNGSSGSAGQVPMNAGPGSPTVWGGPVVPQTRTITINGQTYDLSANRTFTIAASNAATVLFTQGGSPSTTYTDASLIGKTILCLFIEGTPVDTLSRAGAIYYNFDGATGTITLTNGQFAASDHVLILYQTGTGTGGNIVVTAHKKAAFLGDSITDPNTWTIIGGPHTSWPDTTKSLLQLDSAFNVARYGASVVGGPSQNSFRAQLVNLYASHPDSLGVDIVVVALGTNDFTSPLGNYDSAMSRATLNDLDTTKFFEMLRYGMWSLTKQYPRARFYWYTVIQKANHDITDYQAYTDATLKMCDRYNWGVINGNRTGIVREYENVGAPGKYLIDGTHPNEPGKWVIGKEAANVILRTYITTY